MQHDQNYGAATLIQTWFSIAILALIAMSGCASEMTDELHHVEDVEQELMGDNGITLNGITLNGMSSATHESEIAGMNMLFSYLLECALEEGSEGTYYDIHGEPVVVAGLFGLAPEWGDGPLSARGERLVSACLAARTNAKGRTVRLSLRGNDVSTTAVEREMYRHHEGAFWGDLFSDEPTLYACSVRGAGISGRDCTGGDCGFVDMGSCADVCATQDGEEGFYTDCAGEDAVINTFLAVTDDVAFGGAHGCLLDDGEAKCLGNNGRGQLGSGDPQAGRSGELLPVVGIETRVVEVSGGAFHSCARTVDGSVYCWGDNRAGQLGGGADESVSFGAVRVDSLGDDVASIAAGANHTCALTTSGQLWCWGDNRNGQLGAEVGSHSDEPVLVASLGNDVAGLAIGESAHHTCAILNDGALLCWGDNADAQLGDAAAQSRSLPTAIAFDGLGEVTDACTAAHHTCARSTDGSVSCWGSNKRGQLGSVTDGVTQVAPVAVALDAPVAQGSLTCGRLHTCALLENGEAVCWGGERVADVKKGEIAPETIAGLEGLPLRINAARNRTCMQLDDLSWWCRGANPHADFVQVAAIGAE